MRKQLDCLADSLGIGENLLMPGFQKWPGVWVKHSDCFVLSSRWEGSPNALTEALALGVPSVSTRCPSGPDETLDGGRFGPLVEVGDFEGMARAILEVLANPLPSRTLQSAVEEYSAVTSAQKYLQLIEEA